MSYVYTIDKTSNVVLRPEAVKLCPELGVLDNKQTVTLILAYDYYSPYNKFPIEARQQKALLHVYGTEADAKFFLKEKIKVAIDCYISIQYDKKREMINLYNIKIDDLNNEISKTKDETIINDSIKSIRLLRLYIKELEKEVTADEIEAGVVVGNKQVGLLEYFQSNRDFWLIMTKKK